MLSLSAAATLSPVKRQRDEGSVAADAFFRGPGAEGVSPQPLALWRKAAGSEATEDFS